jgi:dienelactone hydrolase
MLNSLLFHIARLVFDLAFDNIIHVAVVAHPSLLKPEDLDVRKFADIIAYVLSISSQNYTGKSKAPLLINSCEEDNAFPKDFAEAADKKFASFAPGYRRTYYEGASHGFTVRGDLVRPRAFSLGVHSTYPCTEQAEGKGCEGRRFQGVGGVADQIPAVKRG